MSNAQHTPGPWVADDGEGRVMGNSGWVIADRAGNNIAQLFDSSGPMVEFYDNCDANARLIAAAPQLLAALEEAKHMLARDFIDDAKLRVIEQCDAAIAAAKGEQA